MGKAPGKIVNWPEYNLGLKKRHDISLWIDPHIVRTWRAQSEEQAVGPGRKTEYSILAISFCFKIKEALGLTFRGAEGFLGGLFSMLGIELAVPDYTTLCRRARSGLGGKDSIAFLDCPEGFMAVVDSTGLKSRGMGEWLHKKHRPKARRGWVKLHVLLDADSGLVASALVTDDRAGDSECLPELLGACPSTPIALAGDGAYDDGRTRTLCRSRGIEALVPPKKTSKMGMSPERDAAIEHDRKHGRGSWKKASGYHVRSNVETFMGRLKQLFGAAVSCRSEKGQIAQIFARLMIMNGFAKAAWPKREDYCALRKVG